MTRKKVLMIAPDGLGNAGVQNVIMNIVRGLQDAYLFDIILFSNAKGYFDEEFLSYGGKIFNIPKYQGRSGFLYRADPYYRWIKNYPKVKSIIQENGPYQVVHCHNDIESFYILKAAQRAGVPVRITHTHVSWVETGHRLRKAFNQFANTRIDRYVTNRIGCSELSCTSTFGATADYQVINNPYNDDNFDKKKYPSDCSPSTGLTLIQIGAYSENKNQMFSLEVFSYIHKKMPSAKFIMVGFELQANYQKKLEEYVMNNGLENSAVFLRHDSNTAELLSKSSYLLFPSSKEGFGLVLVEAQSMGVRCFASDTVPHETDCGGCTYLSLNAGAEKWAEAILEDYKKTNGIHGDYDCTRFCASVVCQEYRKLYEEKG